MCMVPGPVVAELGVAPTPDKTPAVIPGAAANAAATSPTPLSRRQLEDILFDTCTGCHQSQARGDHGDMSAIPQGVLAVRAVAANNAKKPETVRADLAFEHPPLKYNSKLMNSIWGLYNRYSVHNFKKNTDGEMMNINFGSQQQMLSASAAAPLNGALLESYCLQ